ncbi:NAD(P)/FAD-dependent oxidoreductase [Brevibacterium album]|uniref:NAD(P)/FAD-dependent oxidoreductase n=1 Tax=Brevibacterium album TaxID=417948 RepID=UPI0003F71F98|nr:FAD-dependent oxidoreductase [Brevibacterium album]
MSAPSSVVVIGGGQAGQQTVASLRKQGYEGSLTLVCAEAHLPYQRPPLSKAYLTGELPARRLTLRTEDWYANQDIEVVHEAAVGIDREAAAVVLAGGRRLGYDHLVLATGAENRRLTVPGAELSTVMDLRTKDDADALAAVLTTAEDVVIVGAGFIGLEVAASARKQGANVRVLEIADRVMERVLSPEASAYFARAHAEAGIEVRLGTGIAAVEGGIGREDCGEGDCRATGGSGSGGSAGGTNRDRGGSADRDGRVTGVVTSTGEHLPADLVLSGIGAVPRTQLAEEAGLEVDRGIVVDAALRTSDPAISAIGDVAVFPDGSGRRVRLESVQNASDQARFLAQSLLDGSEVPGTYAAVPWFWSDQGSHTLQIAGLRDDCEETVLLPVDGPEEFIAAHFARGRLRCVETVNRAGEHMAARRALATDVVPSAEEARAPGFDLSRWVRESVQRA